MNSMWRSHGHSRRVGDDCSTSDGPPMRIPKTAIEKKSERITKKKFAPTQQRRRMRKREEILEENIF